MVTEEGIISNIVLRYRLGTVLVWVGVLTWAPFIVLRAIGQKPAFLWFLPFHLIGVIGGSRLRTVARRELGLVTPRKNRLALGGHILIFAGILVWAPYLYLKLAAGQPVEAVDYLPYHLTGIFGGILLHVVNYLRGKSRGQRVY